MKRKQPMCILTMNSWHSTHENQVFSFISQKTEVSYEGSQVRKGQILNWWTPVPWILRSHTDAEIRVLLKKKKEKIPMQQLPLQTFWSWVLELLFCPAFFLGGLLIHSAVYMMETNSAKNFTREQLKTLFYAWDTGVGSLSYANQGLAQI